MTWTRAALCWLAALLLGIVVLASRPAEEAGQPNVSAGQAGAPAPAASEVSGVPAPEPGYVLDAATLARVEVRRGDTTVVLERGESGWKVAVPTDRVIPPGLVQAFVEQLVDSGRGERIGQIGEGGEVGDGGGDTAFGLAKPLLTIDASGGGQQLRLAIGARTPAGTAAYALVEEQGRVVLVGLNLLYYADLLLG